MGKQLTGRRDFLRMTGMIAGAGVVRSGSPLGVGPTLGLGSFGPVSSQSDSSRPDYVLRISASPVEIAPKHIVSTITYNGQFPGPLLRFKEGSQRRSKSTTTPTLLSSCTGMAKWFPPTWMALPKKERPSSRRTECAE